MGAMRIILPGGAVLGLLALAVIWAFGGLEGLGAQALAQQQALQREMAAGLRALHRSEPGALLALWGLCFSYGFLHAVGPGHGKFLIGAYGAGMPVAPGRLMAVGLLASIAQGISAIVLVYAGVLLFNASRAGVQDAGEIWMDRAGLLAMAAIGGWLFWRGLRRGVGMTTRAAPADAAAHAPGAEGRCSTCGHRHGPSPQEVAQIGGLRDMLMLIGAIALRPCTGAVFLLVLTWRMGLIWQGIAGALVMALGTGMVTVAVAGLSAAARQSAQGWAGRLGWLVPFGAALEVLAGLAILLVALGMLR